MKTFFTALLLCISLGCLGQNVQLKGTIKNEDKQAIEFANIVLQTRDSNMVTGASSDTKGHFELTHIAQLISSNSLKFNHLIFREALSGALQILT